MSWQRSFQLKEFKDYWRISPVLFYGGYGALELQKELLNSGKKKTFPEWEKYTAEAVKQDRFHVGSIQMHYALADALYDNKDHPKHIQSVEYIREFLEKQLYRPLVTLSKTTHRPSPHPDSVLHTQGAQRIDNLEHLFGSNGYLSQLWDADRLSASLFMEEDAQRAGRVNRWLSKKDTYINRRNIKQQKTEEKCVCLLVSKTRYHVCTNASRDMNTFAALGMRIRGVGEK